MDKYVRNQGSIVRTETENLVVDVYGVERRLELVTRRITESKEITQRNKNLIFGFSNNCALRGLSRLRVLFYLNRFWNIARLTEKNFDKMTRLDIELLVRKIQTSGYMPRTVSDHLTAIKTFWKWLEGSDDAYPGKVRWIKPWRNKKGSKLPEQLLTKEDVDLKLVGVAAKIIGASDPCWRS
jgi:site-specific recombinase XerD